MKKIFNGASGADETKKNQMMTFEFGYINVMNCLKKYSINEKKYL
ncbi:hypothetical protein [Clostridium cellulovorans]|nr:hypothetical protein [Clostridium cellulovorans]